MFSEGCPLVEKTTRETAFSAKRFCKRRVLKNAETEYLKVKDAEHKLKAWREKILDKNKRSKKIAKSLT